MMNNRMANNRSDTDAGIQAKKEIQANFNLSFNNSFNTSYANQAKQMEAGENKQANTMKQEGVIAFSASPSNI